MTKRRLAAIAAVVIVAAGLLAVYISRQRTGVATGGAAGGYVRLEGPTQLTYDELVTLGSTAQLDAALKDKLHALTSTPFISNEAYYRGAQPLRPELKGLGRTLRVVTWNIERGLELDGIILLFTNPEEFLAQARRNKPDADIAQMRRDIEVLRSADVIALNEVDWGLKRTGYRAVVQELGNALNMNWAYGVEFVEVDPISLGTETLEGWEGEAERQQLLAEIAVDHSKLKALHGTAVLSRYPLVAARLEPFKTVAYDWFAGERKPLSPLESGKRLSANAAFLEKVSRQVRRGGRTSLIVTLDVPDLKEKRLTPATHLESNAPPDSRRLEMREPLATLRDIRNPVILAGDLNTTGADSSPTSIKKQVFQRLGHAEFWVNTVAKYATGVGLAYDVVRGGLNTYKNQDDPLHRQEHPVLWAQPRGTDVRRPRGLSLSGRLCL